MGFMTLFDKQETATGRREFLGAFLAGIPLWHAKRSLKLGGFEFHVIRNGNSPRRYLLIHGDESTARQVLTHHLTTARGTACLVSNNARNIPFQAGQLDPNRMFSAEGAARNLRRLNPDWPEAQILNGLLRLERARRQILEAIRPRHGDVLIAVHNNRDYSLNDELQASSRTALNDRDHPHDFCLCTSAADYERLARGTYNVLLQDHPPGDDDGSLSRRAVRDGFRYVNIEAALGSQDKQRAMLQWVDETLPRK